MDSIWVIIKIIIYTFVLSTLYRMSYNFLFALASRPYTWIGAVGLLGISNIVLAYLLEWDARLVSAAVITAILFNLKPSPMGFNFPDDMVVTEVDEVYKKWGLPHGRVQFIIGLSVFALCSLVSYILLFGEY